MKIPALIGFTVLTLLSPLQSQSQAQGLSPMELSASGTQSTHRFSLNVMNPDANRTAFEMEAWRIDPQTGERTELIQGTQYNPREFWVAGNGGSKRVFVSVPNPGEPYKLCTFRKQRTEFLRLGVCALVSMP
ncbi:MAG: hypothetical protein HC921_19260 [Synechococcaceae cyanobacterium SM2_3_1]|nr:hypothetical protein [Synechococcaceae cyanobacterium SM2_3_1]